MLLPKSASDFYQFTKKRFVYRDVVAINLIGVFIKP